jgi:hypothetical protein
MSTDGFAALDRMIAAVERVGVLPELVAKRAAPRVQEALQRTAAAGTTPEGEAWAPKADGGKALANAPAAIEVTSSGTVITSRLVGTPTGSQKVQAIQHYGTKRIPARHILPVAGAGIPEPVAKAIGDVATQAFREAVRP